MLIRFLGRDYYSDRCEREKERDEQLIRHALPQTFEGVFPTPLDGIIRRQFRHFMVETRIVDSPLIQSTKCLCTDELRHVDEENMKPICQWSVDWEKGDRVRLFQRQVPRKPIHVDTELPSSFYQQSQLYLFLSTVRPLPVEATQERFCGTTELPSYQLSPCPPISPPPSYSSIPSPRRTVDSALIPLPWISLPPHPFACSVPPSREMLHLPYELDVPDVPSISLSVPPFHRDTWSPVPLPSPSHLPHVTAFLFVHPSERRSLLPPLPSPQTLPSLPSEPLVAHPRAIDLFQYAGSLSDRCLLPTNLAADVVHEDVLLRELKKAVAAVHPLSLLSKTVVIRSSSRPGSLARSVRQQFAGGHEKRLPVAVLVFSGCPCCMASWRGPSLLCERDCGVSSDRGVEFGGGGRVIGIES